MAETTISIDKAGRLVLPKATRDRFRLRDGDLLSVEEHGEAIELRPVRPGLKLKKVGSVLVVAAETPIPHGVDLLAELREERLNDLARSKSKDRS